MSGFAKKVQRTSVAALAAAAAITGLTALPAHATGTSSVGGDISTSEVISRAQYWVDHDVPYSQSSYAADPQGRLYRQDCSGFVSMAWHLPTSATTWSLPNYAARLSSLDSLQPGDMIDNISEHVVLFDGWTDASHSTARIYEEAHTGTNARLDTSYYTKSYLTANGFLPYRYDHVVENAPTPPTDAGMSKVTGGDFNGDGKADVVAVEAATGKLFFYPGTGGGHLGSRTQIGTSWNSIGDMAAGHYIGSGALDLAAVDGNGVLWVYPGNGNGTFGTRVQAGTGWDAMRDLTGVDFDGDGKSDLVAVERSTGDLYSYPGNGNGTFAARGKIGTGWNAMDEIVSPGDLDGNGADDIVAREISTGDLYAYPGNGHVNGLSTLGARTLIGTGWNAMTDVAGGDFDNDGHGDVDAVQAAVGSTGTLYFYAGNGTVNGTGTLAARTQIGTGW